MPRPTAGGSATSQPRSTPTSATTARSSRHGSSTPGSCRTFDASDDTGERRGFALLGFYEPDESGPYVADLLALGVQERFRRQGVGRGLLGYVIRVAELAGRTSAVHEIRLTVADDNVVGQRLYRAHSFRVLSEDHGFYDGGQRAIRMARALPPRQAISA